MHDDDPRQPNSITEMTAIHNTAHYAVLLYDVPWGWGPELRIEMCAVVSYN